MHNVPRFNNPTSTFDNDRYLLQVFALAGDDGNPDGKISSIFDECKDVLGILYKYKDEKYLYKILVDYGFDLNYLRRKSTTHLK